MTHVLLDQPRPGIAQITLNRPERRNALTYETLDQLFNLFDQIDADHDTRVVVLTGAGRGFCSGADLAMMDEAVDPNGLGAVHRLTDMSASYWNQIIPRMRLLRQPIIGAVNGAAAGAGFGVALGCDIRIAASSATFAASFIKIGLSACELGLGWVLPRMIGLPNAAELLLTGRTVSAGEAVQMGLVHKEVGDDALLGVALDKAEEILANTPFGVAMTKQVLWSQLEVASMQSGIELEARTQILALMTEDQREQVLASTERRRPIYRNR
jgi:enoyl-CoA hydratase